VRRLSIAVNAVLHGADGRNGLRYVSEHSVARCCVIGTLYGTNNRRYRSRGTTRSRDIYLQVSKRFDLTRSQLVALMAVNDLIPWTPVRRVALILMLVGISCMTMKTTTKKNTGITGTTTAKL
jgi:hypothetical protein